MRNLVLAMLLMPSMAWGADPIVPNEHITPGDADPEATMEKLCLSGYTGTVRSVPHSKRMSVYQLYGVDPVKNYYEVDHLISLGLGGSNDIKNLWPQSYTTSPWNARVKDKLESRLHREICDGIITIKEAQDLVAHDWIDSYCALYDDKKTECELYKRKK